jgi:poly-gamma-glutamate capsule biosynthesis protein CapA/YwtB (metallophosphatase superfamily)
MKDTVQAWLLYLLSDKVGLEQFMLAIAGFVAGLAADDESAIAKTLSNIALLLAEYTSGHCSEAELRVDLAGLLRARSSNRNKVIAAEAVHPMHSFMVAAG